MIRERYMLGGEPVRLAPVPWRHDVLMVENTGTTAAWLDFTPTVAPGSGVRIPAGHTVTVPVPDSPTRQPYVIAEDGAVGEVTTIEPGNG